MGLRGQGGRGSPGAVGPCWEREGGLVLLAKALKLDCGLTRSEGALIVVWRVGWGGVVSGGTWEICYSIRI